MPFSPSFPRYSEVVVQGLETATELNGEVGIVQSILRNGRLQVSLVNLGRTVNIRPKNLKKKMTPPAGPSVEEATFDALDSAVNTALSNVELRHDNEGRMMLSIDAIDFDALNVPVEQHRALLDRLFADSQMQEILSALGDTVINDEE